MGMSIFVTTSFVAQHRWPAAPMEVAFLRDSHRHVFKVRAELEVEHDDRDLEFIMVKRALDSYLAPNSEQDLGTTSCEQIARDIADFLEGRYSLSSRVVLVEVSEDGENGAVYKP